MGSFVMSYFLESLLIATTRKTANSMPIAGQSHMSSPIQPFIQLLILDSSIIIIAEV